MARYLFKEISPFSYGNSDERFGPQYGGGRYRTKRLRDQIRDVLDPIVGSRRTHNDWLISDVMQWSGSGNSRGVAFLVVKMDGSGSPTGPCWLIAYSDNSVTDNTYNMSLSILFQLGTADDYFRDMNGSLAASVSGSYFALHFAPRGGLDLDYALSRGYNMAFDDPDLAAYNVTIDAAGGAGVFVVDEIITGDASGATGIFKSEGGGQLTLVEVEGIFQDGENLSAPSGANRTAGTPTNQTDADFSAPGADPRSAMASFMPLTTEAPRGFFFTNNTSSYMYQNLLIDDEEPYIMALATDGNRSYVLFTLLSGNIIEPYEPAVTDTWRNEAGNLAYQLNSSGSFFSICCPAMYINYGAVGDRARFSLDYVSDNERIITNTPRGDGNSEWSRILVYDANESPRGYIKPQVARDQGARYVDFNCLYSKETFSHPFFKRNSNHVYGWIDNEPPPFTVMDPSALRG